MNITSFAARLLTLGLSLVACLSAHATVSLSWSTSINGVSRPTITTNETSILSGPYRLRAKVIDGSPLGFHAATSNANNNYQIDTVPVSSPSGTTYTVQLYSVTYTDNTYTTVLATGPVTNVTVTFYPTFGLSYTTTYWQAQASDLLGGLTYFYGTMNSTPGIGQAGSSTSGNYIWGWSTSHATTSSASGDFSALVFGAAGAWQAWNYPYSAGGGVVAIP